MMCPGCSEKLNCRCNSCQIEFPHKENKMIIISQGAIEACPVCGYSMSPDEWFDLEIEQYLEKKEPK